MMAREAPSCLFWILRFLISVLGSTSKAGRRHGPAPLPGESEGKAPPGVSDNWGVPVAQKPQADLARQLASTLYAHWAGAVHQSQQS